MVESRTRAARTAAQRGFILLAITSASFGFALNAQQNIVTNYFKDVLGFSGPQFGYITAIREIPGFLLIFLTALFFRLPLQRLSAGALVLLTVGYICFGASDSFWTVAPWVVLSSMGYHTFLQTQYALGMSLTTEARSGQILGRMSAISQSGSLVALLFVAAAFQFGWLSFRPMFVLLGCAAFVGAVAVFFFPHLNDGQASVFSGKRDPIVLRKEYKFYYFLSLLDGGRQQVFFSFGLYVLVSRFRLDVPQVSLLLVAITFAGVLAGPWLGRMLDLHGERRMLGLVNVAYIVALSGYAFTDSLPVACACYIIYTFILPISGMGAATYLRKVATPDEVAPSLAMGVTMQHAAAIVVPVSAGLILNYVGYQIPFMIACGFSLMNVFVTRRLDPVGQRSPAKVLADNARLEAEADAAEASAVNQTAEDQPGAAAPIELPRGRPTPASSGGDD